MSSFGKVFILVVMILYVVSPIDLVPGPIDDMIVVIAGMLMRRNMETKKIGEKGV